MTAVAMQAISARAVEVGGSKVHFRDVGAGPAVLLLHGSGPGTTGWGAWRRLADVLAPRHRVVVPDQAGFGATPLPGGQADRSTWTSQAIGLLEELGIERCAVVGHSMGGAIALSMAAARPDRISRVVAVATMGAPLRMSPALETLWGAEPGVAGARELLTLLFDDPQLVTADAINARAEAMQAGAADFERLFPPPRARWVRDLTLSQQEIRSIRAHVLLIHGAADRVTPLDHAAVPLFEQLRSAKLHILDGCGHVPAVESAETFNHLVAGYLAADA